MVASLFSVKVYHIIETDTEEMKSYKHTQHDSTK